MKGFKKPAGTGQRQSFANGGMVRGAGSGTSDSIKTAVPEGSYIMPADSTQAIGPERLEGLGFKPGAKADPAPTTDAPAMGFKPGNVPVNLSNGEFKLSPEQVHAIGAQVLEGLKAATHTPAAQQEREEPGEKEAPEPSRNELYFADGGTVRKPPPVDIAQGLREAVIDPIVSDVRQGNRVLQQEYPLAYQAAQLHPAVGIPAAGLNYADAMQKGDTQGAIAASLSSIPLAEKAYKVGNAIASGVREIVGNRGFRAAANNLGRRFGAGEQTAESFEAGQQQGQLMVKPNGLNFADGGLVEDPKKRSMATSPTNTFPGNQAEPTRGMYAGANAELGDFAKAALPGTATAIQGAGQAIQDAYSQGGIGAAVGQSFRGAMVPVVGLADDAMSSTAKALNPFAQALKTLVTGDATPIGQAAAAAQPSAKPAQPAAASTPSAPTAPSAAPANPNYGNEPNAPANPLAAASAASAQLANNVTREGNSYSGKDIGPGFTINGKEPGGGFVSGSAQPGGFSQGVGGPDVLGILQRENQIRAGMAPLMDQIRFNEGTRGNGNYFGFRRPSGDEGGPAVLADPSVERNVERDRSSVMQAAMTPLRGSPNGQITANQLRVAQGLVEGGQRDAAARYQTDTNAATQRDTAAMREEGETARSFDREQGANQRARASNQIQQQEMGLRREAQGFQTREAQRKESLQARYEAAKTPEERSAIAQEIRDLSGKNEPANRFTVVPGGQAFNPDGTAYTLPARVLNNQTGQFVDQPQATDQTAVKVGEVRKGYRFKGGNPADQASWEKV
ncbi:hypothetical protein [Aquabacterium sp.]|uniref:hypothetical protein n=1 Tax=Aquabacterium sp. TaxID=1872578 RepID=UPI00262A2DE8|nr:hypothetical protein [Aquabacterium sp.]MDD2978249.1 hypothetical protein [Aquabacterium sp.]